MTHLLERGQSVVACGMQSACVVKDLLGEGGQAEVYRARIGTGDYALKWYRADYIQADPRLWERLKAAIRRGMPTDKFLWPFDLTSLPRSPAYGGYLMPIKEPQFISLVDLIARRSEPSFRSLTTLAFHLADSFLKLHASGLCYRDINFGNIFFHPLTGDIRIGDTDNVDIDGKPGGIMGTWGFMAPEVARYEAAPSSMTDRFSLAVLLFYIFVLGHPLKGKRELTLPYDPVDPDGSKRLCALDPVFVFDPVNDSNRPAPGIHEVVQNFWAIYPNSLRDLFTCSFTQGLREPHARVTDNGWRRELCQLRDSIFPCPQCSAELFFDLDHLRIHRALPSCWSCGVVPTPPPRMRVAQAKSSWVVMLPPGAQLFGHHLDADAYNFTRPLAEVLERPYGLRNLSGRPWTVRTEDQPSASVPAGATLPLTQPCRIEFGKTEADVRL
jgi:eukaryotic-like serine/threonine-protein kinase